MTSIAMPCAAAFEGVYLCSTFHGGLVTFVQLLVMNLYTPLLTIGELSERTSIGISALRAWERRYGFPVPERVTSGHRRYSERDVAALLTVLREREEGSSLEAALQRAKEWVEAPRLSIFATLRDSSPAVEPILLSKPSMLALSRAIEDEASMRADQPLFVGTFQEKKFWNQTSRRWQNIAARAELTIAMASMLKTHHGGRLSTIAISRDAPLAREWAVVCDSPNFSACLVGVEQPNDGRRRFEAMWTVEPPVVRAALQTALGIAVTAAPDLAASIPERVREPAVATYDTLRAATSLTNRTIGYLDPLSA